MREGGIRVKEFLICLCIILVLGCSSTTRTPSPATTSVIASLLGSPPGERGQASDRKVLAQGLPGTFLPSIATYAAEPLSITINISSTGKTIKNKFSDINMWTIENTWLKQADTYPVNYFKSNFPFVERIQIMAATGGNENRDLFKDPRDRGTVTDYDFNRLIEACNNIIAKGLKPMIKTGWVPLKLSADPRLGVFQTNIRPPGDYDAYYGYIRAIAETLKTHFGLGQMKTWSWGVGVEYENKDWLMAGDSTSLSTKLAYFKLYDCTVSALEDALGMENVVVGAHSMTCANGLWDECEFIEHCAKGTNYRTGKQGTKLDFLAISYYTGVPGFNPGTFMSAVETVRKKAVQVGLNNLKYGVDEGRVLNGWDKLVVYAREVQHPVQAVSDAKLFHLMVDNDVDYFSTWSLTTKGLFGGIPVVSANFRNLAFRMTGSMLMRTTLSGRPADSKNEVNGLAGYDAVQKILRVMIYNFNPNENAEVSENISLCIANAKSSLKEGATVRTWRLDQDNGNWWKSWQEDVTSRKLQAQGFKYSLWTLNLPRELRNSADVEFWNLREAEYGKAGELRYHEERKIIDPGGQLLLQTRIAPYGVVLFEIFPVEVKDALHNPE